MSKIALNSNASGSGVFTIESPNSDTDRTLNLPDKAGTVQVGEGIDDNATSTAITIDSSENVSVSPSGGVITLGANGQVTSKQSLDVATAGGRYIGSTNRGVVGQIRIEQTATGADGGYVEIDTCATGSTSPIGRMRIDSSGMVGIGTPSPARILHVEKDGNADLLLRDTSSYVSGTGPAVIFQGKDSGGTNTQFGAIYGYSSNSSNSGYIIFETRNAGTSAERVRITEEGQLVLRAVKDDTTSDSANMNIRSSDGLVRRVSSSRRYKNSIVDSPHGLDELLALRSVRYKGNNDGDKIFGGFIAEEVHEAGLTEFVQYNEENEPDALAYAQMVALCTKAIQEQQAMIEDLKAEVAALKAGD